MTASSSVFIVNFQPVNASWARDKGGTHVQAWSLLKLSPIESEKQTVSTTIFNSESLYSSQVQV